jgi:hypothetical protein
MKKRNISFVIVGVVAVLLFAALPMIAGESQNHPKNISEWFTTLSEEQREQFDFMVREHVTRYLPAGAMGVSESFEFFVAVWQSLQEILTPEQFAAFEKLLQMKPDAAQPMAGAATCYSCVYARTYAGKALNDLQTAESLFVKDNCTPHIVGTCPGPADKVHPVWCSIKIAIAYTQNAKYILPTSPYSCSCINAEDAREDIEMAIHWLDKAIRQTSTYNCSPTPWLTALNNAMGHLVNDYWNALDKVEECVEDCCN